MGLPTANWTSDLASQHPRFWASGYLIVLKELLMEEAVQDGLYVIVLLLLLCWGLYMEASFLQVLVGPALSPGLPDGLRVADLCTGQHYLVRCFLFNMD